MIYQTAIYEVNTDKIETVKQAIKEFTQYVKENESGTLLYLAWQKKDNPQTFIHFFIFQDEIAQNIHSQSDAVKKFESIYSPTLISKGVEFQDYEQIASNYL